MRVYRTDLTAVEAVEGRGFCGGGRAGRDDGQSYLQLFKKES
jgi:hypothetical protein